MLVDRTNEATRAAYGVVAHDSETAPRADLVEKALRSATGLADLGKLFDTAAATAAQP